MVNVTVTGAQKAGFLTAFPWSYPWQGHVPDASTLNFAAGQTVANLATILSTTAQMLIYNASAGSVQIIVDEEGYYINAA